MHELIAEIPTRGTARLARKLSVDVYDIIPEIVRSKTSKRLLIAAAHDMAKRYGINISALEEGSAVIGHASNALGNSKSSDANRVLE